MHVLLGTEHRHSVARGLRFLRSAETAETPLWHGKELYEPRRIVDTLVRITIAAAESAGHEPSRGRSSQSPGRGGDEYAESCGRVTPRDDDVERGLLCSNGANLFKDFI